MFSSMLSLLGSLRGGSSFVTNSLRFRSSASAYLSRTPSNIGNTTTFTWSGWVKRGALGAGQVLFGCTITEGTAYSVLNFNAADTLQFAHVFGGIVQWSLGTSQVFRDPSAWYHIVAVADTGNPTVADRLRLYINGVRATSFSSNIAPSTNAGSYINSLNPHAIGRYGSTQYFDGYLTEVHFIDSQALTPASFGAIDSSTGVWAPRPYSGTYGTNGFYLKFANTSSVAALGNDSSGNAIPNNWTVNNVSLTAGATYDSMIDVPVNYSDGGNNRGNYATWNQLEYDVPAANNALVALTNGNLDTAPVDATNGTASNLRSATIKVSTGKWYWEITCRSVMPVGTTYPRYSILNNLGQTTNQIAGSTNFAANDIIGIALDADTGKFWWSKNNVLQGGGDPVNGTNPFATATNPPYSPAIGEFYSTAIGFTPASASSANFGQRPFQNTTLWATLQAAGFRALNTQNLSTPPIVNGANFMAATAYTGNAAARSLSNAVNSVSFQPDLVWIKSRTPGATSHALFDSVRGTTKYLSSDTPSAETTLAQSLTAFGADGFSLGTDTTLVNANANSYIAWQWRESITAGLDVVSYTGTGVNTTIAHNLGVVPAMIIVKRSQTGATSNWQVRHTSIAAANSIQLNSSAAEAAAATVWNSTAPTSSVFSIGTSADVNASGISYIAYCFAEIAGFSRFGTYTGNGLTNGPFVFCGFRPRWIMVKRTNNVQSWQIIDTTRNTTNTVTLGLYPNVPDIESSNGVVDILSNGFKIRSDNTVPIFNATGGIYIFAAFAEVPSKYALAR